MRLAGMTGALLLLATAAHAETITAIDNPDLNLPPPNPQVANGPQSQTKTGSGVSAYAFAAYGVNKTYAFADTPDVSGAIFTTNAMSEWRDELTVEAAGAGVLSFFVHVGEELTVGGGISAGSFRYVFDAESASDSTSLLMAHTQQWLVPPRPIFDFAVVNLDGLATQVAKLPRVMVLSVAFQPGEAISLTSQMTCYAASRATLGGCDASHSAYWGGVASVVGLDGKAMDWTLKSASGTDYADSFVPEPRTWALMLLGFGAVGGAIRSRRRPTVAMA